MYQVASDQSVVDNVELKKTTFKKKIIFDSDDSSSPPFVLHLLTTAILPKNRSCSSITL